MRKTVFWKSDWFLGLLVSVAILAASGSDLMYSLERKAYDLGMQASEKTAMENIAVIAVDDVSIANIGRWSWSRDKIAKMTDMLVTSGAKVVANTIFFFEPQIDPGLHYIKQLQALFGQYPDDQFFFPVEIAQAKHILQTADISLNIDRILAGSIGKSGNVLLPMLFRPGEPYGRQERILPEFLLQNRLLNVNHGIGDAIPGASVDIPVEAIGSSAAGIGHLNAHPDIDGAVRNEPLVLRFYDDFFPSLSLLIAAKSLNLGVDDIQAVLGQEIRLGRLRIPVDAQTQMNTFFYKDRNGRPAFQVDSFYDVFSGKIPIDKYRDKIVLIGATAAGVGVTQVTPVSPDMAPVLILVHTVSSILQGHFFQTPEWDSLASFGAFLCVALYLIILLPRLSAGMGAAVTALLLALLLGTHYALMTHYTIWIQLMVAATLLLVGHILLTTRRFLVTERGKERSEAESVESSRMLGLAFQGQGQLDMAFDKFRKCPMDNALMENLYNLGLDFERKRQFNKAEAVFRHMADFNLQFRDLPQKLQRARAMSETIILGGRHTAAGPLILSDEGIEKPMLGRYQVEKELGKGAMGVVYLGRDPKINRVVAIKTLALSQEFDEEELADVTERFFREAETAGRLNHQNIVTIYDAGEEHDLAYIAMEFLKGRELTSFTKTDNLLPIDRVISIVAQVADALAYAHHHHVVHRDIKPANVMYEPQSDQVKVTDFGIARITDISKTKTGMVLGTPNYMSPEQLSGERIDGRSDLFSLGVMLYQLLCGRLPFAGDSMTQLMYQIANEEPVDLRLINPQVPEKLTQIVAKALNKKIDQRYQSGDDMARDLRAYQGMLIMQDPHDATVQLTNIDICL